MSDERKNKSSATPPENVDSTYGDSPQQISAAPPSTASLSPDDFKDDDDFEFAFVVENSGAHLSSTADELFSEGQIRRIYPVFNRDLLLTDEEEKLCRQPLLQLLIDDGDASISHSSSLDHDLEALPAGSYCVWKPESAQSPETVRKSSSTGSSRRRWIRDFVVGRSHSDGKEKFMFISAEEKSSVEKEVAADEGKKKGKEKKKATEFDLSTAHQMFYGQSGNGSTAKIGSAAGRKSYLPYKPGIVGFFARVNGISRAHHPF